MHRRCKRRPLRRNNAAAETENGCSLIRRENSAHSSGVYSIRHLSTPRQTVMFSHMSSRNLAGKNMRPLASIVCFEPPISMSSPPTFLPVSATLAPLYFHLTIIILNSLSNCKTFPKKSLGFPASNQIFVRFRRLPRRVLPSFCVRLFCFTWLHGQEMRCESFHEITAGSASLSVQTSDFLSIAPSVLTF